LLIEPTAKSPTSGSEEKRIGSTLKFHFSSNGAAVVKGLSKAEISSVRKARILTP